MGYNSEDKRGSDCSGSSGATNRVLTLTNTQLTFANEFRVFVNGLLLVLDIDYTISHLSASSTITFLNAIFDSAYIFTEYQQGEATVNEYCSASDVNSFLQLPDDFSSSTNPKLAEVESLIDMNQDLIDREIGHAFRTTTAIETFDLKSPQYDLRDGYRINLSNRKVKDLDSGQSDVLTVWDGSTDLDYLANKTEGRNNDFWFNYDLGILHIKHFGFSRPRFLSVNITYRFGEAAVPNDIKKACILLTAMDIVHSDDRSVLIPEGTSNIPLMDKSEKWRREAFRIIQNRRELKVVGF